MTPSIRPIESVVSTVGSIYEDLRSSLLDENVAQEVLVSNSAIVLLQPKLGALYEIYFLNYSSHIFGKYFTSVLTHNSDIGQAVVVRNFCV